MAAAAAVTTAASALLHQIATETGQRASVTLSDGSHVTVGGASRIRVAPTFGRTREVYLDGEAFFEVAHDASRPFIVRAARGTARAVGTKFNIDAYYSSPELAVLVVRQSDGIPGQGWWVAGGAVSHGYNGPWEGPKAASFIRKLQQKTFDYWAMADIDASG
jgi:hypothetical protein